LPNIRSIQLPELAPLISQQTSFFTHKIKHKTTEGKLIYRSAVKIACVPCYEASRVAAPPLFTPASRLSSKKPFARWSQEKYKNASYRLRNLGMPLQVVAIKQLYMLIRRHQRELAECSQYSYPALFDGESHYTENNKTVFTPFKLELHSNRKAYIIFNKTVETFIKKGKFKILYKVFSLGLTKMIAYSIARFDSLSPRSIRDAAANEELFLSHLHGERYIAKIYDIFYYTVTHNNKTHAQQIITMKYYKRDLFDIADRMITKKISLTDQEKVGFSCKILEAVLSLETKNILHRDLKLENILISARGKIKLIDYGFACLLQDPSALTRSVGSHPYLAPEVLLDQTDKYGTALSVWSVGCILWILWFERAYPWYSEFVLLQNTRKQNVGTINNDVQEKNIINQALLMMKEFTLHFSPSPETLIYPFWRMLDYNPETRWSIRDALSYFQSLAHVLSKNVSYNAQKILFLDLRDCCQQCKQPMLIKEKITKLYLSAPLKK